MTTETRTIAESIRSELNGLGIGYPDPKTIEQIDDIGKALAGATEDRRSSLLETLFNGFSTIARLSNGKPMTLYKDFAPLSFTWGGNGWVGGLIFHGSHDGGGDGGMPSLSVCLSPVDGWSIHT